MRVRTLRRAQKNCVRPLRTRRAYAMHVQTYNDIMHACVCVHIIIVKRPILWKNNRQRIYSPRRLKYHIIIILL